MRKKTVFGKIGVATMAAICSVCLLAGCANSGDRNSDEVQTENVADPAGMVHLDSAEDVSAFFEEVYGGVAEDLLPWEVQTTELDLNDTQTVQYHTGLTDMTGIAGIYLSESMMSSVAYSAVYIRTADEADAEQIRQQLMDNIDPAKWICVTAEKQSSVIVGKDIFFVMGAQDTVDEVMNKAVAAAKGREMNTSEASEKINPI